MMNRTLNVFSFIYRFSLRLLAVSVLIFVALLALIVEVWTETIWLDYDKDRLAAKAYVLDIYTQLLFVVNLK